MKIINADCLLAMKEMPDNSVDAIVTDPPYGLSFMGKKWDYDVPSQEIWEECLRVLKPGGYLLAFAGTRTQHRMAVRIEDAGFEIRDMIAWIYGSGFPKSLNIGKSVDKIQGNEREETDYIAPDGKKRWGGNSFSVGEEPDGRGINKATKGTSEWEGWGTSLKPALEPITVARKPIEGNVAQNCLKWGVGGINIDGCRVGTEGGETHKGGFQKQYVGDKVNYENHGVETDLTPKGRFPANLIHDNSEEVRECFPETKSIKSARGGARNDGTTVYQKIPQNIEMNYECGFNDSGNASRFFKSIAYYPKASKSERNRGCEGLNKRYQDESRKVGSPGGTNPRNRGAEKPLNNFHPTVKPIALMEYLIKLVSREGQTVLDPFAGSGTTGIACKKLGREFIGIEKENDYCKIAEARIGAVQTVQEKLYD